MKELNPNGYATTPEQQANLNFLLNRLNKARALYNIPMTITSGLRSQEDQDRINPSAPKSKHLLGQAADIRDSDGHLRDWVLEHLDEMAQIGFWFEDFRWTGLKNDERGHRWVHFQVVPPNSGARIFRPSLAEATDPNCWDGMYDHALDSKLNPLG